MTGFVLLLPACLLLAALLYFENRHHTGGKIATKALLSGLFILVALVQPHSAGRYFTLILTGLLFCMGGDVCLALPQKPMFLAGLVSFLIGHIFYIFGFAAIAQSGKWAWGGSALLLFAGIGIFTWLRPHLGTMKLPVLAYIAIISIMMAGAWTAGGDPALEPTGRLMVFTGALLFYVSDLFVARNRFLKMEFLNRLIGLPLYYAGQFIIAFSTGIFQ